MLASVAGLLASPRRRRRLSRFAVVAVFAAGTTLLILFVRNTGESFDTPLRLNEPAQTYVAPKTVELTPDALLAARRTAFDFVRTAVAREHLEDAWELAGPAVRQGMTKAEWLRGAIPVVPYPADLRKLHYQVEYSYPNLIALALRLEPKDGFDNGPMTFAIELHKARRNGNRAQWLVASWAPLGLSISGGSAARSASGPPAKVEAPLSAVWLFVPLLVLSGIFAIPAVILTRNWLRGRRAERAYRAEHGL